MNTNLTIFLVFLIAVAVISALLVKFKVVRTVDNVDKKALYFTLALGVGLPLLGMFFSQT